jgi:hypothetical protein
MEDDVRVSRLCPAGAIGLLIVSVFAVPSAADPLTCDLAGYKSVSGLTAALAPDSLTVAWDGDAKDTLRLRLGIDDGTPTVLELAVRGSDGSWRTVAEHATPEFRVVSGLRRMSNQQLQPLRELKVPITPAVIDKEKWHAFWDAPLFINPTPRQGGNPPPADGIAGQPGMPRQPAEIRRASATFRTQRCAVTTNGSRLEISFDGLEVGVFAGRLQFTVYKGTNLVRMEAIARTAEPSVAYKYDAGLKGLTIAEGTRVRWRDTANTWQAYGLGGALNDEPAPVKAANRILMAETPRGTLATFPPPHTFFWAREIETNLGYLWYRKDSEARFSFGIRQAEREDVEQYQENFALYSAPAGTWQRMAVYFHAAAADAAPTLDRVLAFTRADRFKPLPGYQVMAHHYHMDVGQRLRRAGSLDAPIDDFDAIRATGITIVSPIDSVFVGGGASAPRRADPLDIMEASLAGARRHSDRGFLIMPNQEVYGSPLGGHTDLLFSHPVYWNERAAGQPFVEDHPRYGRIYHIGGAEDFIEMARREDILISMPHPRTKGSTGYPDAIKDQPFFEDPHYHGVGFRWGMGLDLSEQRLCDGRCLTLLDDMSNWTADRPGPPKYLIAITETRFKAPGDEVYASSPVNYVKLDRVPPPDRTGEVVQALMRGDSFVTSGEVLIASAAVEGSGAARRVVADLEWTFPLEFVEIVWGDGRTTGRKIVSATDLPPFGKRRFDIPFDAAGQKWVRFAAWDSAGNGAVAQPVKLGK